MKEIIDSIYQNIPFQTKFAQFLRESENFLTEEEVKQFESVKTEEELTDLIYRHIPFQVKFSQYLNEAENFIRQDEIHKYETVQTEQELTYLIDSDVKVRSILSKHVRNNYEIKFVNTTDGAKDLWNKISHIFPQHSRGDYEASAFIFLRSRFGKDIVWNTVQNQADLIVNGEYIDVKRRNGTEPIKIGNIGGLTTYHHLKDYCLSLFVGLTKDGEFVEKIDDFIKNVLMSFHSEFKASTVSGALQRYMEEGNRSKLNNFYNSRISELERLKEMSIIDPEILKWIDHAIKYYNSRKEYVGFFDKDKDLVKSTDIGEIVFRKLLHETKERKFKGNYIKLFLCNSDGMRYYIVDDKIERNINNFDIKSSTLRVKEIHG